MNAYLSREEKENFIRATALAAQLQDTIDGYAKAKSTDPEFLKYLRTGRTMVAKALTMRADALDMDTKTEFAKQLSRMELIFVPTLEAKKAYQEVVALKTTLPMELGDFEDWYESVIETTCKWCRREDYADCKTRRVLAKYGVYPIDPGAEGKCQYSYVGTPEQEDLQPVAGDTVPAEIYNLAVSQRAMMEKQLADYRQELIDILYFEDDRPEYPSMSDLINCVRVDLNSLQNDIEARTNVIKSQTSTIRSHEDVIKDLNFSLDNWSKQYAGLEAKLAAADACIEAMKTADKEQLAYPHKVEQERDDAQAQIQAAAAAQEAPKEEYPVSIGLASGGEFEYVLPAGMAEAMIREIQQPRHSRSTCAQYAGGRLVAIDLQEVVALNVDKLPQGDWVRKKDVAEFSTPAQSELERYRVECKCGSEYFADMNTGRSKAWCRTCKGAVFADRQADKVTDPSDGVEATLLTNLYWVERDPKPVEPKRDLPTPKLGQSLGRNYKDPCNPFS